MRPDGLFELKRKWLPLFVLGVALFGAGLTLALLWLYRQSPFTDFVVDVLTPNSPEAPPRGTLISLTAAIFTAVGGLLLLWTIRGINASEVGEIDSFWWKVAVAALAGNWWLGQPPIVVLAAGPGMPVLLRALKTFTGRITVLARPTPELALALADDEPAVQKVLAALSADLDHVSDGLRLRGRFLTPDSKPLLLAALAQAEAVIVAPALDEVEEAFGLKTDEAIAQAIRRARGRRILVGATTAGGPDRLAVAARWCENQFGPLHTLLVNNNTVQPLPPGRGYQKIAGAVERDLIDWERPEQWEAAKLAIFLREAVNRPDRPA
jgi:hypothetical protein